MNYSTVIALYERYTKIVYGVIVYREDDKLVRRWLRLLTQLRKYTDALNKMFDTQFRQLFTQSLLFDTFGIFGAATLLDCHYQRVNCLIKVFRRASVRLINSCINNC